MAETVISFLVFMVKAIGLTVLAFAGSLVLIFILAIIIRVIRGN